MIAQYELRLLSPYGIFLFTLDDVISLTYGRKKNDEGIAIVELSSARYDIDLFDRDYILEIYKVNPKSGRSELQGNTCWFLRKVEQEDDKITLTFYDTITLLTRRIIAWAGVVDPNYPSIILEYLDNIITLIAWYNFGSAVVAPDYANANIPGYVPSGLFASTPALESWQFDEYDNLMTNRMYPILISSPSSQSQLSGTHRFEFETVLTAMQEIAESSQLQGESLWFDIEYIPPTQTASMQFQFKTWVGVRGTDRTLDNQQLIIGPEFGNIANVKITKDWTEEAHIVYVGGNGDNELKDMASISTNAPDVPFTNIEAYISVNVGDGTGIHETEALQNEGRIELARRGHFQTLQGEIISQPPTEFGKNFHYGDLLIVKFKKFERPMEVSEYKVSVDKNGEKVDIPFTTIG